MAGRLAVYPGSFDPLTRGHLDILDRALRLFDRLIVAVSNNPSKSHTFAVEERIAMVREALRGRPRARVDTYSGLLVDYLRANRIRVLIRGLRAVSDMDYEFQLASMNRRLYEDVETVFLMPDERNIYLSSSMVKEIARLGAVPAELVPAGVARRLAARFSALPAGRGR